MKKIPPDVMKKYLSSSGEVTGRELICLTHGPPGVGKTMFALSASKYWPGLEDRDEDSEPAVLNDIIFLAFDTGALDGLKAYNIHIPYTIDAASIMMDKGDRGADLLLDITTQVKAENDEIRWCIVDTVTSFDNILTDQEFIEEEKKRISMYGAILVRHRRFFMNIHPSVLGCKLHLLCHSTMPVFDTDKSKKRAEIRVVGESVIIPQITGKAANMYIGAAGLEMALLGKVSPGGDIKRIVYPFGGKGYEGKNRWHTKLKREEPAEMGTILKKIGVD